MLPNNYTSLLLKTTTPAQYVGGEVNSVLPAGSANGENAAHVLALAFPDLYHVGMSNLGLQILREVALSIADWKVERAFLPAPDMEKELRAAGLPLLTLDRAIPLKNCDLIGISIPCELHATGIPALLDVAQIPPLTRERGDDSPLIIAGGHGVFNPEIFVDFIDAFVIGEGEEVLAEILRTLTDFSRSESREKKLSAIAEIPGVYVPAKYPPKICGDYEIPQMPIGKKIVRRVVENFNFAPVALRPLVPLVETAHERGVLEIMRGCPNGCRFCQAGMVTRPLRYRTVETLCAQAEQIYKNTGYDEIGLLSLSTSDHPQIDNLLTALDKNFAPRGVNLSLPSLRVNEKLLDLPKRLQSVRKSGLTFAPEAGSDRLRAVINKKVTNADLLNACREAFARGWRGVKLYFMIGLPTETVDDVAAIAELCNEAGSLNRRVKINCSVGNFIPKPFTPFQWCAMESAENLREKQALLARSLNRRAVDFKSHSLSANLIEAALARGDRRLGKVIYSAFQRGARLDNWTEHFDFARWEAAFAEHNLTISQFAERTFPPTAQLPWSHIDIGVNENFLRREYEKSLRGEQSPICGEQCGACGIAKCQLKIKN